MTILQTLQEKELPLSDLMTKTKEYISGSTTSIVKNGLLLSILPFLAYIVVLVGVAITVLGTLATVYTNTLAGRPTLGANIFAALFIIALVFLFVGAWHSSALQTWIYNDIAGKATQFKETAKIALKKTPMVAVTQLLCGLIIGVSALTVPLILALFSMSSSLTEQTTAVSTQTQGLDITYSPALFMGILSILVPMLLFIVIAIAVGTYFSFSQNLVIIRDRISPWGAIKRSIAIVKGRFWRVFGRMFAGAALLIVADLVMRLLLGGIFNLNEGLGMIASVAYFVAYLSLCYFVYIYQFFLFINLDSSKPEKPIVVS